MSDVQLANIEALRQEKAPRFHAGGNMVKMTMDASAMCALKTERAITVNVEM